MITGLPESRDEPAVEVTRTSYAVSSGSAVLIERLLRSAWLGRCNEVFVIDNPFGPGTLRIAAAPIGLGGNAVIVAGSTNPEFPSETHRLVAQENQLDGLRAALYLPARVRTLAAVIG